METKVIVFQRGTSGKVIIEEGAEVEIVFKKSTEIIIEQDTKNDVTNVTDVTKRRFVDSRLKVLKGRDAVLFYRAAVLEGVVSWLTFADLKNKYPEAIGSRNQLSYWLRDPLPQKYRDIIDAYRKEIQRAT